MPDGEVAAHIQSAASVLASGRTDAPDPRARGVPEPDPRARGEPVRSDAADAGSDEPDAYSDVLTSNPNGVDLLPRGEEKNKF